MGSKKGNVGKKVLVLLPLILLCILVAANVGWLFFTGTIDYCLNGPKIVMAAPSPDGKYEAYVPDLPCADPPNQTLIVESSDKINFMQIANLAGDIDSIKEILWAPDSQVVMFHSHRYLTAVRIKDWQTVRIYLGKEWRRTKPSRISTFTSGGVMRVVTEIEMKEDGKFTYRLQGDENLYKVDMDSVVTEDLFNKLFN